MGPVIEHTGAVPVVTVFEQVAGPQGPPDTVRVNVPGALIVMQRVVAPVLHR